MNLVNRYSKNNYLEGYGILNRVRIASVPKEKSYHSLPELELGKVYTVRKIKKCTGQFKCAKTCTTGCYSVMIDVWDNKKDLEIGLCTCGHKLATESGKLIRFNK